MKGITPDNRIIIGITDKDGKAVNGVPVTVIAKDGTEAKDLTNSEGIAIVPRQVQTVQTKRLCTGC